MAQEAWRAYLEFALGATEATRKKATKSVKQLVGKGAMTAEQLQGLAEDLLKTSATNREALTKLVRYELDRALGAVGLATADDVSALTVRVRELEGQLAQAKAAGNGAAAPPAQAAPIKRVVAKNVPAKQAVADVAAATLEAPVTPAGRAVAKKAAAAKKAPAQKAPAQKAPAKKTTPVKQTAAKKAPVRRVTA